MIARFSPLPVLFALVASACHGQPLADQLSLVDLPDGFSIEVYADDLDDARTLETGGEGIIFVGTRRVGNVYALVDRDGDGGVDEQYVTISGLTRPNGLAYRAGSLFVSDGGRILRYDDIDAHLEDAPDSVVVVDDLPQDASHGWRYMDFGPDDRLYVSIGAPCNTCEVEDPYGSIISMEADGTNRRIVARGVRNSVGFAWNPMDGSFWFTDNGRDRLGDDLPSCELNRLPEEGAHFGFPYFHQGDTPDPDLGEGRSQSDYVPPVFKLGAHVAPLGIEFYTGDMFPNEYTNRILIAEHGSWNRSSKVGYRVVSIRLGEEGLPIDQGVFAEGFLQGEEAWGRPVDLEQLPDGSLLVSDDLVGAIYRISYTGER